MDKTMVPGQEMTVNQLRVLELDRQGLKPTAIAKQLALSLSGVNTIRRVLRSAGHNIAVHQVCAPGKRAGRPVKTWSGTEDSDEPYGPWRYCKCGLRASTGQCDSCVTVQSVAYLNPDVYERAIPEYDLEGMSIAEIRAERAKRGEASRVSKQRTRAALAGQG